MNREDRFEKLTNSLMEYSESFKEFSRLGRVHWNKQIPTACITYTPVLSVLKFEWNPDFFDLNSDYKNLFIFCHEMLHVFLNHGKRMKGLEDMDLANIYMDISINHLLVDGYGFDRNKIEGWEELCWRDTVFNTYVDKAPSFEGYFKIDKKFINEGFSPIDIHKFLEDADDKIKEATDMFQDEARSGGIGDNSISDSNDIESTKNKKRKFESVVKNVIARFKDKKMKACDSWGRIDRRLVDISEDLPVEVKEREVKLKSKYLCLFFIDNSGSCGGYQKRFVDVANSLDESIFDARIFTFDTRVYEVFKVDGKYRISGGGGTDFRCIQAFVEESEQKPDLVMVLTDGEACPVYPKNPKLYHWFLTEDGTTQSLKRAGKIYRLSQFE